MYETCHSHSFAAENRESEVKIQSRKLGSLPRILCLSYLFLEIDRCSSLLLFRNSCDCMVNCCPSSLDNCERNKTSQKASPTSKQPLEAYSYDVA